MKKFAICLLLLPLTAVAMAGFPNGEHSKWVIDKQDRFDDIDSAGNGK